VAGGGGLTGLMASFGPRRFWVNNPYGFEGRVKLEVTLPDWLIQLGWDFAFVNAGGSSFTLPARGSREVLLALKPGADFSPSDVPPGGAGAGIIARVIVNFSFAGAKVNLYQRRTHSAHPFCGFHVFASFIN
jgi:hypothetical protein